MIKWVLICGSFPLRFNLKEEIKNLIKGIKPKRDDDFSSDSSDSSDNKKEPSNKGPLPSFTKDQNFPLPN